MTDSLLSVYTLSSLELLFLCFAIYRTTLHSRLPLPQVLLDRVQVLTEWLDKANLQVITLLLLLYPLPFPFLLLLLLLLLPHFSFLPLIYYFVLSYVNQLLNPLNDPISHRYYYYPHFKKLKKLRHREAK